MDATYWHRQGSESLFPELEWNKPERRDQAGRLLIVGGNVHALTAPGKAYEGVLKAGIGSAKIALPDKTKRLVGQTLPDAVFLPSTPSGEFSQEGSHELLEYALWADTVLLPGDNGRNSQTTIILEELMKSYTGQIVATRDAVDSLVNTPETMLSREKTTLVVSFAQLQKLIKNTDSSQPLQFSMSLVQLVEFLHDLTLQHPAGIITLHQNQLVAAVNGSISTTKLPVDETEPPHWRLQTATLAACHQTWNPIKPFEALAHTAFVAQSAYGKD